MKDIFNTYQDRLFHYFLKLTNGNTVESEDLVQIVFHKVLIHISNYKGSGSLESWIFAIARNCGKDYYRKKNLEVWLEECPNSDLLDDSFDLLFQGDQFELLYKALSCLKPRDRELISLSLFKGLTFRTIAGILGISETAAKTAFHRATNRLRSIYLELEAKNY